jgi:CRISPR-associated endonuclease/helicase Cas3
MMQKELNLPFIPEGRGRYRLDPQYRLSNVQVNPQEALALYLGGRRLQQQTKTGQRHVASALQKLAGVLRKPMMKRLIRAAEVVLEQEQDPVRMVVMERLMEGWTISRKVRIHHHTLHGESEEYLVSPYQLEPAVWGDGIYLIGDSKGRFRSGLTTFKVERIEWVTVTMEPYTIPDDFDSHRLLQHAWGIWHADKDPEPVRLQFTPFATPRVKESIWHPSQTILELPDGGCIWEAQIAEIQEMKPWVRGWGSEVEVLLPDELQKDVLNHASALVTIYGVGQTSMEIEPYRVLWAKADRKSTRLHRLIYHLIDVGLAAELLWERALHPLLKQSLADWLNLSLADVGRLIAFLAGLHDLGKASPAFQDHTHMQGPLKTRVMNELKAAGFGFAKRAPTEVHTRHEIISTWALRPGQGEGLFRDVCSFDVEFAIHVAQALGGHHGIWPRPDRFDAINLTTADKGGQEWTTARAALVKAMAQIFQPPSVTRFPADVTQNNLMLTLLSAVVAVADWIGSEYFPLEEEHLPLHSYVRHARLHAEYALDRVQWTRAATMPGFDFDKVFPFKPSEAQQQIRAALNAVSLPALAIIEAPMGVGKTEAAFAVYADWARHGRTGLYIAMPTTATSNQMHERTTHFLSRQLGREIEPLLIHSQALLREVPESGDPVEDREGDAAAAQSWFLPRKKSLLTPYGVGTVDQALMSILQTKHFFVRLLGLAHKVVIFDEVHAYDAYMSELFERLLTWLRAVNASVIILSATLPEKSRRKLVRAYTGEDRPLAAQPYPRVTFATADGRFDAIELIPPPAKTLYFDWLPREEAAIIAKLRELLSGGGCAAVICNTVTRAQNLFEAIRGLDDKLCEDENLLLFHARFPLAWREEIEQKVLHRFGPGPEKRKANPDRPRKAIVIATQVIEQSLDLDFDVMISDHAPVDLLLQRVGRLQRHSVNNPRSHAYCLWIAEPPAEQGVPQFDRADTYVNDKYILLRSWLALKERNPQEVRMPLDMSALIEKVYGEHLINMSSPKAKKALDDSRLEMIKKEISAEDVATERLVREPSFKRLLTEPNMGLGDEDDPTVTQAFRALTRMGDPGVQVVCLHWVNDGLCLNAQGGVDEIIPNVTPDKWTVLKLAGHCIQVRHPDPAVERALLADPIDPIIRGLLQQWKRIGALRFCRVVIFDRGIYRLPDTPYILSLDPVLGLRIQKESL